MNFLFWNVQEKPIFNELVELISDFSVDVVVLAEYSGDTQQLLRQLDSKNLNYFSLPNIGCERIQILTNISPGFFHIRRESDRISIREFLKDGHLPLLFLFAHLPSKKNYSEKDQTAIAADVRRELEIVEAAVGHSNTLVIGDLNMNPFESGIVAADAFNAISCLKTALRGSRVVQGKSYKFFYNPMWNLFGDTTGTPGSYFYLTSHFDSHYWNIFDQVLVRPKIAKRLDMHSLKIIDQNGDSSFVNTKGRPSLSDHLPLFFSFDSQPQDVI